ncbi:MAG: leucine-rich repeat domain-containing protein [Alphaproteobacteria bacterium]|nr:leucine-rich repeat domain-containing protein [Alphaproteobacteria bacterium]
MRKNFLVLSIYSLLMMQNVYASTSGNCGTRSGSGTQEDPYVYASNCTWVLEGTNLTISGSGEMGDFESVEISDNVYHTSAPWGVEVTNVTISDGITSIGQRAFLGTKDLTTVSGMNDVTTIGGGAFNNSGLTSISLPNSVTSLGEGAFGSCFNLSDITLSNSLESISRAIFWDTPNLTSLTIPSSVTTLEFAAFDGSNITSLVVPSTVTSIEAAAFAHTPNLTSLVIEGTPDMIGDVFYAIGQDADSVWGNTVPLTIYCLAAVGCGEKADGTKAAVTEYSKDGNGFYQIDDKLYATADLMTHNAACDNAANCQAILDAASQGKPFEVGGKYYATLDLFANGAACTDKKNCEDILSSNGNPFKVGSKIYNSMADFANGNYVKHRIYTIEEANFVAGTVNRVSIKYR